MQMRLCSFFPQGKAILLNKNIYIQLLSKTVMGKTYRRYGSKNRHNRRKGEWDKFSKRGVRNDAKRTTSAVNRLIEVGEFKSAKAMLLVALYEHPKNIYFINLYIKVCGMLRDLGAAEEMMYRAVKMGIADKITYSSMIGTCLRNGMDSKAEEIFHMAAEAEKADAHMYSKIMNCLYKNKKFYEILSIAEKAPDDIRCDPGVVSFELEASRKMKKYDYVIKKANELLGDEREESDFTLLLKIVKAYAIKDKGEVEKAKEEFREMLSCVGKENVHYARVLCGIVFCGDIRSESEAKEFMHMLNMALENKIYNESAAFDIACALEFLESQLADRVERAPHRQQA